jgi:hypothetical protein
MICCANPVLTEDLYIIFQYQCTVAHIMSSIHTFRSFSTTNLPLLYCTCAERPAFTLTVWLVPGFNSYFIFVSRALESTLTLTKTAIRFAYIGERQRAGNWTFCSVARLPRQRALFFWGGGGLGALRTARLCSVRLGSAWIGTLGTGRLGVARHRTVSTPRLPVFFNQEV